MGASLSYFCMGVESSEAYFLYGVAHSDAALCR